MPGRHPVLAATIFALMLGGLPSPVISQAPDPQGRDRLDGDGEERRVSVPGPRPVEEPGPAAPGPPVPPRLLPRPAWPREPGDRVRDGWSMDDPPPTGLDGLQCWPHGDHFHCR